MSTSIAIVGNPNVGKSEVFNSLTGLQQTTGNYPGVTVSRKVGKLALNGTSTRIIDLPGTYSLAARSPDEQIAVDVLLGRQRGEEPVDAILVVIDASNVERNLYLLSQVQEFDTPVVVALNMMDIAADRGLEIQVDELSRLLGVPVLPICAHKRVGTDALKKALVQVIKPGYSQQRSRPDFPHALVEQIDSLQALLDTKEKSLGRPVRRPETFRILVDEGGYAEKRLLHDLGRDFGHVLEKHRTAARSNGSLPTEEARWRYAWARELVKASIQRPASRTVSLSEKIDYYLTHKVYGTLFFTAVMLTVFQAIYSWAAPIMNAIDGMVGAVGDAVAGWMPGGILQSLVVDGVIAGIGSVLIFLPQILILTLFIALLQDCGYMARGAFLMDKMFSWCGLSGQSFIPMLSSFACAIPGLMATRTIENPRHRLATMLVAPLMSCSARLPVYVIMIAVFVPSRPLFFGLFNVQGMTLFSMYMLGIFVAVPVAWLLKYTLLKGDTPPFVLELPSYKMPRLRTVGHKVYLQSREFLRRAGTIIFCVTVIVWAMAYFPHSKTVTEEYDVQRHAARQEMAAGPDLEEALLSLDRYERGAHLENSILGTIGHSIEPAFRPLGWDWRISTAVIASFPAREIIIATLGTIFNMGENADETSEGLRGELQGATWPSGDKLFNLPVALSVMVFFALCCQCSATLVMIRRESGSWKWPIVTFTYMTVLAYIGAFVVYRGALFAGWGAV